MYELGLGIAHLEFKGPNSTVWMAIEFECGNWPKFRAKSTMCYFDLAYFQAAPLRIGWNCKKIKKYINFFNKIKNVKIQKIKKHKN
jgi:hypothetical protein